MLYDIKKIEESYIFPGDGASHTRVKFRFVVFRPFIEEILIGRIRSCSADGVHGKKLNNLKKCFVAYNIISINVLFLIIVTLGFFEDIVIPPYKLQHPSRFDQMEQVWVWEYKTDDGQTHDLFMDAGIFLKCNV